MDFYIFVNNLLSIYELELFDAWSSQDTFAAEFSLLFQTGADM